mgnify:CR=1 FL=1
MKWLWISAGLFLTGLAALGAMLPLLPTTPFALGAAACFARSSPRLEAWLLRQPGVGTTVVAWRDEGAIATHTKVVAISCMAISGGLILRSAPLGASVVAVLVLLGSAWFVGSRPAPGNQPGSHR